MYCESDTAKDRQQTTSNDHRHHFHTMHSRNLSLNLAGIFVLGSVSALLVPGPQQQQQRPAEVVTTTSTETQNPSSSLQVETSSIISQSASAWLAKSDSDPQGHRIDAPSLFVTSAEEPSNQDIQLLRQAFSEYYAREYVKAVPLLDSVIDKWSNQPDDERAGLYRVRADCFMGLANAKSAYNDYDQSLKLLNDNADPSELPTALLGRARAGLAGGSANVKQIAEDYKSALVMIGDDEYDDEQTEMEALTQASNKNPYAMWEYADALRKSGKPNGDIRMLSAQSFASIGDAARSLIAKIDAGIDYAGMGEIETAETTLAGAIAKTVGVEGRDVRLLQRVITKEGEGRLALAALYWSDNQKLKAETVLGDACLRLDQLVNQMDGTKSAPTDALPKLGFSIDDNDDDIVGSLTCTRFKNKDFLTSKLEWPESLQDKVLKLQVLKRYQQ